MSDQFVYFIQADENGPIKIGFTSDDPKRRLSQLQTGNASPLRLLGAIKGDSFKERELHAALAEWRMQGEWFQYHPTVIATIKGALMSAVEPVKCDGSHCSFCGICQHDAVLLISGSNDAFICDQCAVRCAKMAGEHFLNIGSRVAPLPEMGFGA